MSHDRAYRCAASIPTNSGRRTRRYPSPSSYRLYYEHSRDVASLAQRERYFVALPYAYAAKTSRQQNAKHVWIHTPHRRVGCDNGETPYLPATTC